MRAWREHFEQPLLFGVLGRPEETIDVIGMARAYAVRLIAAGFQEVQPFTLSAQAQWRWGSLHSARTASTEEDLLTELLGREEAEDIDTERPWLRVDLSLVAAAHLDARVQVPEPEIWRRWAMELSSQLEPLLPSHRGHPKNPAAVSGWRGEPSVELRCGAGGQLFVSAVKVEAWEGVDLPRQWDDPDRPYDSNPVPILQDLAQRLRKSLDVWRLALRTLQSHAQVH